MTRLLDLYEQQRQSPWLDNIRRSYLTSGQLQQLIDKGIRGMTSNPTIFAKAIEGTHDYDAEFGELVKAEVDVETAYWQMATEDITSALDIFRPLFDSSGGGDGFVSLEVDPGLARETEKTIESARSLHQRINRPNLLVKIPATEAGLPALKQMFSEGRSINVTLIFSLARYDAVIEQYLSGLEALEGDLSHVNSVASFFVSRIDTEVDRRLEAVGTPEALELRGTAAVASAKVAYQHFLKRFSGPRWEALEARGAKVQRPLWASTSTKNPEYSDTMYVDDLIGPHTVNTMPDKTVEAFAEHGHVRRTVDEGVEDAERDLQRLGEVGVDLDDVTRVLEEEGVAAFSKSFDEMLSSFESKAAELSQR